MSTRLWFVGVSEFLFSNVGGQYAVREPHSAFEASDDLMTRLGEVASFENAAQENKDEDVLSRILCRRPAAPTNRSRNERQAGSS